VHRIVLCSILVSATAWAGESGDDFVGAPSRSIALGFVGHDSHLGALSEGGMGADLEAALGSDRAQYFGELTMTSASVDTMPNVDGYFGRAGVGVRWLARQFQPERGGGFELVMEAVGGVERYWWKDGGRMTRPDLGLGIGLQMRAWKFHGLTMRLVSRVMFAPTDRESSLVACRGSGCPMGTSTSIAGFMTGMVFAW
jgi:hypothetical protein